MNNQKCIYLYADILGYKNLLKTKNVSDLKEILNSSILDIEEIIKEHNNSNPLFITDKIRHIYDPNFLIRTRNLKMYFAFDTIVIYWDNLHKDEDTDNNSINLYDLDFFLNLCSIVFINLYVKYDILIRGVISISRDFFIDNNIFIIKDIEKSFLLEKNQSWGNIILCDNEFT